MRGRSLYEIVEDLLGDLSGDRSIASCGSGPWATSRTREAMLPPLGCAGSESEITQTRVEAAAGGLEVFRVHWHSRWIVNQVRTLPKLLVDGCVSGSWLVVNLSLFPV